jgi:NADPH-dependent 2,4-dienoyl-CoA reductase/sulfur reductase-like enzyme
MPATRPALAVTVRRPSPGGHLLFIWDDDDDRVERGLVIVGGSDAGIMAGLWAREVAPDLRVTLLVRDTYPNFSICGIPFFVSGETAEWSMLAHRTVADLQAAGLRLLLDHDVIAIDPSARTLSAASAGDGMEVGYDELVIGTGAAPVIPPLPGMDLPGVHVLHTIDDARTLRGVVDDGVRRIVLIGAGYVGTEMADALTHAGVEVTIVEMASAVLTTFDTDLGVLVGAELERHGVTVMCDTVVERLEPADDGQLRVLGRPALDVAADAVLVAVGVRPESTLAAAAGARVDARGAIVVDTRMATGVGGIWAAGDCVHTHHVLHPEPVYLPLGTTAHKQGRVAGINAAGGDARYAGSLGTQSVKILGLVAARTGLRDSEAVTAGYDPISVTVAVDDHKAYYPGATTVHVRITGDRRDGKLLGAQLIGAYGAEISKRVDIVAAAIHAGATVGSLGDLDLSYTPPLSSPWDPVQTAAHAWVRGTSVAPSSPVWR